MSIFSSPGNRNFDACTLKDIEYRESIIVSEGKVSYSTPADTYKGNVDKTPSAGVRPLLRCPKTEDTGDALKTDREFDYMGYGTKLAGLKNLRKIASKTICSVCEYAGKSPIEVADMRSALAIAQARALVEQANLKHLQDKIANGEDIVADLPENGGVYRPAIEK